MKYKIKHEKANLLFMSSVIIFCLITCIFWIMLREYIYFFAYLILILIISYIYYFTYYFLEERYLVFKLGFIKIKLKYSKIKKVENLKNNIKLTFNKMSMNIYPNNKDIFYLELNNKMKGI